MAEQDREYLVGSVWPTNRSGVLGDTELDGRLPPGIKLVHVTMDFQEGTQEEFARSIPGYEAKAAGLMDQRPDLIRVLGAPPFMILGFDGESQVIRGWEQKYGVPFFHVRAEPCARPQGARGQALPGRHLSARQPQRHLREVSAGGRFRRHRHGGHGRAVPRGAQHPAHGHRRTPQAVVPPPFRRRGPVPAGLRLEGPGRHRRHRGQPRSAGSLLSTPPGAGKPSYAWASASPSRATAGCCRRCRNWVRWSAHRDG